MKVTITKTTDPLKGVSYRAEGEIPIGAGVPVNSGVCATRQEALDSVRVRAQQYVDRQPTHETEEAEVLVTVPDV